MIYVVIGTRAQLIKMAPVMKEMQNRGIEYKFIFTGQHKETISDLIKDFKIKKPDFVLYNGKEVSTLFRMPLWFFYVLFNFFRNKKTIIENQKEINLFLVHGDTASTLLGAFMAKLVKARVAHIESGLRSYNFLHPFPEEIIRLAIFHLTDIYFCPNEWAIKNIKDKKGVKINTHANTLFDSVNLIVNKRKRNTERFCVVSIHRFENIFNEKKLKEIVKLIELVAKEIKVVFVLHKPTRQRLVKLNLLARLKKNKNIILRRRMSFSKFINLINASEFVITDGGSNQEECFYLGKPCLLLRKTTERIEGIGKNVVVSNYDEKIVREFLKNYKKYKLKLITNKNSPSKIIVDALEKIMLNLDVYRQEYFLKEFSDNERKTRHFKDKLKNVMEMVLPIKKGEKILDIGTCSGTFAFECRNYKARVFATDISEIAINYCKEKARRKGFNDMVFAVCSAERQPFKSNFFDKIILADLIEHLPYNIFLKTLKECKRLLKKGGKLIIYTPNRKHIFEWLKKIGVLKQDPTHINLMDKKNLEKELRRFFSIEKSYYRPSHLPIFNKIERLLINFPLFQHYFGRRLCIIAIK